MNSRLKSVSRLSVVFILVVVISGSILTYFGINNISNLKELTEKSILEEEKELSVRFKLALQTEIEEVTAGFINEIKPTELLKDSVMQTATDHNFITLPFILKNNGSFLYPNFGDGVKILPEPKFSNRFKSAYRKGEKTEFAKKDLKTAKKYYLSCLNYSAGCNDSVKALNALGRVSVKLNEYDNAFNHYNLIISDFYQESCVAGLSYVYYAIPQLFKLTNPDNYQQILPLVVFCLEKMETGSIPLNAGTEELLTSIVLWSEENMYNNPGELSRINILVEKINQQLRFINEYSNEMTKLMKKGSTDNQLNVGNGFKIIHAFSGNNQQLLLVNTNYQYPVGFLIDGNKLFSRIAGTNLQHGFEFDYRIEFPIEFNSITKGQNPDYATQLNPYFPGQTIQLILKDENIINEIVTRRSWIYGFSALSLLLAMFLGVALIQRDIAREKHVARLKADFISNVTHELKTPLTSIYMFAESLLLGRVKSGTDRKEYLAIILKEIERLKRMINNILEFSKMEKGNSEYRFVNTNLASILVATINDMNYWFEKEKFSVITELDENIEAEVEPEKIKQAMGNLLSNAIKYSTHTKKIIIRLFKKANHICIEVEDHGIGIAEDQLSKIFEKYYRIDQKESISGTGLGLTVVSEIIKAHNGSILVSSKFEKGSKFSIILNQKIEKI